MAGKREKPEDILSKLRQFEVLQGQGMTVRGGFEPPTGDDPTHKPLKTRLSLDFSSCNRRILVYGLVYDQDPCKCQYAPYGYRL